MKEIIERYINVKINFLIYCIIKNNKVECVWYRDSI